MRPVLFGRVVAFQGAGKKRRVRQPSVHSRPGGLQGCTVMERRCPRPYLYSDCDSMSDPSILLNAMCARPVPKLWGRTNQEVSVRRSAQTPVRLLGEKRTALHTQTIRLLGAALVARLATQVHNGPTEFVSFTKRSFGKPLRIVRGM